MYKFPQNPDIHHPRFPFNLHCSIFQLLTRASFITSGSTSRLYCLLNLCDPLPRPSQLTGEVFCGWISTTRIPRLWRILNNQVRFNGRRISYEHVSVFIASSSNNCGLNRCAHWKKRVASLEVDLWYGQ